MPDNKDVPPIKIGPEDLEKILRKFEEEMLKQEELRKGKDIYKKSSMIDAPIDQPDQRQQFILRVAEMLNNDEQPRLRLEGGGAANPIDQEIIELEMFVGLRPGNSLEAMYIEEMKDRLNYLYKLKEKDSK